MQAAWRFMVGLGSLAIIVSVGLLFLFLTLSPEQKSSDVHRRDVMAETDDLALGCLALVSRGSRCSLISANSQYLNTMEFAIGVAAAAAIGLFATVIGFDKERSFYPVVLIVIATLYLLFAVMAGSTDSLVAEAVPALVFVAIAALGFRKTPWLVVAGLALHGVFDFFHHAVIANPGVPVWWPGWCLAYDVVAAAYLAALILIRRTSHAA